ERPVQHPADRRPARPELDRRFGDRRDHRRGRRQRGHRPDPDGSRRDLTHDFRRGRSPAARDPRTPTCPGGRSDSPSTKESQPMSKLLEAIDVAVPVRTAYDQWTQFETFPRFMEGVKSVRQLDDSTVHWVAEIGGRHKEWDATITEQQPDERIAWTAIDGAHN